MSLVPARSGAAPLLRSLAKRSSLLGATDQHRTIVHKDVFKLPDDYPPPYDYKNKPYGIYRGIQDYTIKRLHNNSRLIVVEGNVASGKSQLAAELADQFGFLHMPDFRMEDILIDRYGNDYRKFYNLFPNRFRMPDLEMFFKNPDAANTAVMQDRLFLCRWEHYMNALAHILNTGQGVVLERSPYTDFVFTNALRAKGFISPYFYNHYFYMRLRGMREVPLWPHIVIYLKTPVDQCLSTIKARGFGEEAAVVDRKYLETIEKSYVDALNVYKKHSHMLLYDWSEPAHIDSVVRDVERIDLDFYNAYLHGDVTREWNSIIDNYSWARLRTAVTNKRNAYGNGFTGIAIRDVQELYVSPADWADYLMAIREEVLKSDKGYGFIKERGDKIGGLWNHDFHHCLPEPWYAHYFKEAWYNEAYSLELLWDWNREHYHPRYLKHH